MKNWKAIQDFTFAKIRDSETQLPALAKRSGVTLAWLRRVRYKPGSVKDPGFMKVGAVFQALGGRAPKVPRNSGEKDGSSPDVQDQ